MDIRPLFLSRRYNYTVCFQGSLPKIDANLQHDQVSFLPMDDPVRTVKRHDTERSEKRGMFSTAVSSMLLSNLLNYQRNHFVRLVRSNIKKRSLLREHSLEKYTSPHPKKKDEFLKLQLLKLKNRPDLKFKYKDLRRLFLIFKSIN